ncbi:TetR/AcrR family transcriptional regulator [Actinomycetospora straminea]|uniref:TetR/AcrR family transcriptional regulator n=1 Tax=Actinomycetospora straminea TaxID=663607 RepID=A0ABP9DZY4_9PSEU|nr:TetR/AcrR family transcriptional regulator [Actinomycetospora straminea]MDD7934254.1 TetR/AcrR family transcriptional regulator [Actinomycetospora straminea]
MAGVRVEQKERTRRALVGAARTLFASRGYADVGLAEIVAAAGVTKGALYHQFDGKAELFRAVLGEVAAEVADAVVAAARAAGRDTGGDPWAQLRAGCRAFLVASTDPARVRIALVDGPAVLGWAQWRALDEATSQRHLVEALEGLVARGLLAPRPVAPLAHLLGGAMNEAALWLADEPDALEPAWTELAAMLDALR